jgi:hypothetical protein
MTNRETKFIFAGTCSKCGKLSEKAIWQIMNIVLDAVDKDVAPKVGKWYKHIDDCYHTPDSVIMTLTLEDNIDINNIRESFTNNWRYFAQKFDVY